MKKHQPTDKERGLVETMAAFGIPREDIAKALRMGEKTLRENYQEELETAATKANARVAQSLFNQATGSAGAKVNITAAIFWLKCRAGWREVEVVEHTGKDGAPIGAVTLFRLPMNGRERPEEPCSP